MNLQGHNIRIKHLTIHQLHRHQLLCDGTIKHYLSPPFSLQQQLGACLDRRAREGTTGRWYKMFQASQRMQNQTKCYFSQLYPSDTPATAVKLCKLSVQDTF